MTALRLRTLGRGVLGVLFASLAILVGEATPAYAGGGMCHANAETRTITTGTGLASDIRGSCYTPTVLYIERDQTVVWTNRDTVPHTVTGVANAWGSTQQAGLGQSLSFRFDAEGTFPYFCVVHPMMQAVVVVGDGRPSGMQPIAAFSTPASFETPNTQAATPAPAPAVPSSNLGSTAVGIVFGALATAAAALIVRRTSRV